MLRRPALRLENLEARDCPALTISVLQGSLTIKGSPLAGDLSVTETAQGKFQVADGAKTYGTYNATNNLTIQLTSRPGAVNVDLQGRTLGGNLLIDLGNGFTGPAATNRTVNVYDSTAGTALGTAAVRGNLTILNGDGNEAVNVGAFAVAVGTGTSSPIAVGGALSVTGRASTTFADTFQLGEGTVIGATASVTNFDGVTFGLQDGIVTTGTVVGGDVSVTTAGAGNGLGVNFFGTFRRNVTVNAAASSAGSLGNTLLIAPPDVGGNSTIGGNLNVTLGTTPNSNGFTILASSGGTVVVNGSTSLTSNNNSSVPDSFDLQGQFAGPLAIRVAGAGSTISIGSAAGNPVATVNGDLTINAGNGTNTITLGSPTLVATLSGKVNLTLGNGTNTVAVAAPPSGLLTYTGGNGNNDLTLNGATAADLYNVNLRFGTAGTQSLTLNTASITGRAFSGTPATSTFTNNGEVVDPFTINF